MKKILIALTIVISCLGISRVSAQNLQLTLDSSYNVYKSTIGDENINNILNEVLDEYKNVYMSSNPYYFIQLYFYTTSSNGFTSYGYFYINLFYFSQMPTSFWEYSRSPGIGISTLDLTFKDYDGMIGRKYPVYENNNYIFDSTYINYTEPPFPIISLNSVANPKVYEYIANNYYLSNFDLYIPRINDLKEVNSNGFIFNYDNILIPTLDDSNLSSVVSLDVDTHLIKPYYLYDTDINVNIPDIEEINLNDYAYVALSLKDYNEKSFETTIYVKGQYCLTPVYNYGMTERKDILEGTQVDRCSLYYDNYTPIRTYILDNDLKNNAIYYLKSYDTTRDNYVKVDTSVFDITYVTEENKDNPYVTIGGKTYPTIPYDSLTDTATKSEDEGYVSGAVEEFSFSDIFTAPLDFLMEIWGTIVTFFDLITSFIALLPAVLQNFLYASFMLAIVLGLIKIIL